MLTPAQLRPAAFAGLTPHIPMRTPETGTIANDLCTFLNLRAQVERIQLDRQDADFFRVFNHEVDLFIRIENETIAKHLEGTENIARWLLAQSAPVNATLDGFPKRFQGRFLFAYPFMHARYLEPNVQDMARLGTGLKNLHATLALHPQKLEFKKLTHDWLSEISFMRAQIAQGDVHAGPRPDILKTIACDTNLDFIMPDALTILTHGDINAGNVMVDTNTNNITFLDFEDVSHSVLPPAFDLIRALERQIFVRDIPDAQKHEAAQAFLNAYGAHNLPNLNHLYQSHLLRSLCILSVMEQKSIPVPPSEWLKFLSLYKLTQIQPNFFTQLTQG